MQRAAASSPNNSASSRTPNSEPVSKRRRIDIPDQPSTPTPVLKTADRMGSLTEQDPQGRVRREGDETEWFLNLNGSTPQTNGHFQEEQSEDDEDDIWANQTVGRQTYGTFQQRKAQTTTDKTIEDDLSPAPDSDGSSSSREASRPGQSRKIDRPKTSQVSSRPAQASKRFYDQISTNKSPPKGKISKRDKKQNTRKKPRITI